MHPLQNIIYSRVFFRNAFLLFVYLIASPYIFALRFSSFFSTLTVQSVMNPIARGLDGINVHDLQIRSLYSTYVEFTFFCKPWWRMVIVVLLLNLMPGSITRIASFTHTLFNACFDRNIFAYKSLFVCMFFFTLLTKSRHRPAIHSTMMASHVAWKT